MQKKTASILHTFKFLMLDIFHLTNIKPIGNRFKSSYPRKAKQLVVFYPSSLSHFPRLCCRIDSLQSYYIFITNIETPLSMLHRCVLHKMDAYRRGPTRKLIWINFQLQLKYSMKQFFLFFQLLFSAIPNFWQYKIDQYVKSCVYAFVFPLVYM